MPCMTTGLRDTTIATVKATRPVLVEHGGAITVRFYERLFTKHRDLERLFAGAAPGQDERLASAILAYVDHLEDLSALEPVVGAIAEKHSAAGVEPSHYVIVGDELLGAMVDVLGPLDVEVLDAWAEAYDALAAVFIDVEASLLEGTVLEGTV